MNKALIYTTRSLRSITGINIIEHFHIIEKYTSDYDVLSANKTDTVLDIMREHGLSPNKKVNYYNSNYDYYVQFADWMEIYEKLDVEPLKHYDMMYLIGGLYMPTQGISSGGTKKGVFPKKVSHKFLSLVTNIINVLAMVKAHNTYGIPLHELTFDPDELYCGYFTEEIAPKFNDKYFVYHGYDNKKEFIHRLDSTQYYYSLFEPKIRHKEYELVFGYTYAKDNRLKYINEFKEFSENIENKLVFEKDFANKEINTYIGRNEYLQFITKSRFTYMMPSYRDSFFSVYRLIESIKRDCLPILNKNCVTNEINESFGINLDILKLDELPSEEFRLEQLKILKEKILPVEITFKELVCNNEKVQNDDW